MNKKLPSTQKHTTKKVKFMGTEQFLNVETGELQEFQVQDIAERDFNFTKVWMRQFIQTLDLLGNQKTRIALWIIDNIDRENRLVYTLREISKFSDSSLETVRQTINLLQSSDFIRKKKNGLYVVNADVVYKGSRGQRLNVLNQYHDITEKSKKLSKEEIIENYRKAIHDLESKIAKLQGKEILDVEVKDQYSFNINGNIVQKSEEIENE